MNWLSEVVRRLMFRFHSERFDRDLQEEMRLHVDLRSAEKQADGMPPDEARRIASRQFGNLTSLSERSREAWGWAWIDRLIQDLRYACRTLIANPGFTATAVLSLTLGIGANTAIFSLINALMLRSLPVDNPDRLVQIAEEGSNTNFTNPLWEQIRDHQHGLAGVLAFDSDRFDLSDGGESRFAEGSGSAAATSACSAFLRSGAASLQRMTIDTGAARLVPSPSSATRPGNANSRATPT